MGGGAFDIITVHTGSCVFALKNKYYGGTNMKTVKKTAMLLVTLLLLAVCLTACQTTYAVTYKVTGPYR